MRNPKFLSLTEIEKPFQARVRDERREIEKQIETWKTTRRERERGREREDSISWQDEKKRATAKCSPPFFFSPLSFRSKETGVARTPSVGWGEILHSWWCELWLRISSLARGFYEWITRGAHPPPLSIHPPSTLWAFSALSGFRRPIEKRIVERLSRLDKLLIERSIWDPVGQSEIEDFKRSFILTIGSKIKYNW